MAPSLKRSSSFSLSQKSIACHSQGKCYKSGSPEGPHCRSPSERLRRGPVASHLGIALGGGDGLPPVLVHHGELLALGGQLLVDVGRLEDGLQVEPVALDCQPRLQHALHDTQLPVPLLDASLERPLRKGTTTVSSQPSSQPTQLQLGQRLSM